MVFVYNAFSIAPLKYVIPLFLVSAAYIFQKKVNIRYSSRDICLSLTVSAVILLPFYYIMSLTGRAFELPPLNALLFHLLAVSFPEEVYFRGLLQERLGNNYRGILIVSVLFSVTHLPGFIIFGDVYSLMTFFPSLVMGYLYMRTSNVLAPAIFHFLANTVFLGLIPSP
jgi:membrane protease YdiL (CAAX protease family)